MILNGRLEDWSVPDLLQIIRITAKTAALEISTEVANGVLFFEDGAMIDAIIEPGTPGLDTEARIIEAVYVLAAQSDGTFAVGEATPSDPTAPMNVDEALQRAGVFIEAETTLREAGLLDAKALRVGHTDEDRVLTPAAWSALASLVGEFTFGALCERIGRSGAVMTLRELRSMGLLEAAFERVAGEETEPVPVHDVVDDEPTVEIQPDVEASRTGLDEIVAAATQVAGDDAARRNVVGVAAPADTRLVDVSDVGQRFRVREG